MAACRFNDLHWVRCLAYLRVLPSALRCPSLRAPVISFCVRLHSLDIPEAPLADFCRRHGVQRLALFGSILSDDFRPDSDVDILVEFLPGVKYSLLDLGGMLMELREMLGREVDLKTPLDLSRYFRDDVVKNARTLYAA